MMNAGKGIFPQYQAPPTFSLTQPVPMSYYQPTVQQPRNCTSNVAGNQIYTNRY